VGSNIVTMSALQVHSYLLNALARLLLLGAPMHHERLLLASTQLPR
jgi:hypothetical protein